MALFDSNPVRRRLRRLLAKIEPADAPPGWVVVTSAAIGGLTDLGFSERTPRWLLVVSSRGRGVFDCATGECVARDRDTSGHGFDPDALRCEGIGPLAGESIRTSGLHGGGLPHGTHRGESVLVASPDWPVQDLYFCSDYKSALMEGHDAACRRIGSEVLRTFGFSWCGNFLVAATGSDLTLWKHHAVDAPS